MYGACSERCAAGAASARSGDYGDLCHYGWNVWNAFKGATNRFYDQTELAEWLKASFESLAKYNTKTLRAKLRATDGGYRIRLLDNLKEYIQK